MLGKENEEKQGWKFPLMGEKKSVWDGRWLEREWVQNTEYLILPQAWMIYKHFPGLKLLWYWAVLMKMPHLEEGKEYSSILWLVDSLHYSYICVLLTRLHWVSERGQRGVPHCREFGKHSKFTTIAIGPILPLPVFLKFTHLFGSNT